VLSFALASTRLIQLFCDWTPLNKKHLEIIGYLFGFRSLLLKDSIEFIGECWRVHASARAKNTV